MDLVLVQMENSLNYLFQAPKYSIISEGDLVICDTKLGDRIGKVVAIRMSENEDGNFYKFVTQMIGVTTPLSKIKGVVRELEYDES